ncbi:hypothetical protein BJ508DRAFT_74791 [Ascobolus immersus RN42]|uniref:Uncharacterized protein n=1 Tax=Ascobolus immersus RN42 TaxID=1160509 RepID=A0A3N4INQ7_ASCIM|nr:hypothetical protein BJ508DRAFT_74791 [Ascobolus immersus RN42]
MDNVLLVDVDSEETSVPVPQQPAHLPSPPTSPMRERLKELPRLDSSCSTAEADAGYDYAANNTPAIARRAELRRSRVREKPSTDVELDAESKGESLNDRSHAGARQSDSSSLAEDAQIGPDQIEFDGKPRRSSNKKLFKRWIEKAAEAASQKIPCYPESVFKNVVFSHPDRSRVDEDEKDDLEKPLTHFLINSKEAIYDLRIFKKTAKKFLLKSPKHAPLSEVDSLQAKVASVELALDAFRRLFQWVVINNVWMLEFNCKDIPEWHSVSEDAEYLQGYVLHWADVSGDGIEKVKGIPLHLLWVVQLLVPEQMVELLQSCNCDSEEWRFTGQSDGSKTSKTACPISLNETLLHYFKRTSDATASQCIRKQVDVQRLLLFSSSLRGTISRVLNIRFSPPPQDHENSIEESDSRPVSTLVAPDNHFGQAQSPATSPQLSSLNDQVANLPSRPATGGATQGQTSDNAGAGYSSDAKDPTQAHSPTPAYLFPRKHILDLILQLKTFHSIEEIQPSGINHDMYTCNNIKTHCGILF